MGGTSAQTTRSWGYAILITLAAGHLAGRILSAEYVLEPSLHRPAERWEDPRRPWPISPPPALPFYSSNDRARWATIRALVEQGTYSVGYRLEYPPFGELSHLQAQAVLLCRALGTGTLFIITPNFIPPILPPPLYSDHGILFEPGYTSVDRVLHPQTKRYYSSKPPLLPTLIAGEYWLIRWLFGWSLTERPMLVAKIVLFTWNWLPFLLYLVLMSKLIEYYGQTDWGRLFSMGAASWATFLSTFSVTLNNHTQAATGLVFGLYPFLQIWRQGESNRELSFIPTDSRHRQWWYYCLAGLFAGWTACNELPALLIVVGFACLLMWRNVLLTIVFYIPAALLPIAGFAYTNYLALGEWWPAYEKFGSIWYEYPGSYWAVRRGIDAAREPVWLYMVHLLVGHHGIFSLSPVFLLSLVSIVCPKISNPGSPSSYKVLLIGTGVVSLIVFLFYTVYVYYALKTSNYGGWTSGPRWFFWLIPLWLLSMLPAADWLAATRTRRFLGYILLAWSAVSVAHPAWNPWRHPWLYNWMEALGWIRY
ncbi:MAG: hypothetical protein RMI91_09070 [Gemmatales bacterium]|nr:hypothetical protein [Gemmatales bacterium]MDW7994790.1 hypothetical protein [Gemmatales bacterium]